MSAYNSSEYDRIKYDGGSGDFTVGLTVSGATASGVIEIIFGNQTSGELHLSSVSGTFVNNESITDTSTGSASVNGAITSSPDLAGRKTYIFEFDPTDYSSTPYDEWVLLNDSASGVTGTWANETEYFLDPGDSDRLIAMTRWDDVGGELPADLKQQSYRVCDLNGTDGLLNINNWGSRVDADNTWRDGKAGSVNANTIGGSIFLAGYSQLPNSNNFFRANFITEIDASDMSVINQVRWNYGTNRTGGENGNGASLYLNDGRSILSLMNSGVVMAQVWDTKLPLVSIGGVFEPAAVGGVDNPAAIGGVTF
jgi:hypothetical protein